MHPYIIDAKLIRVFIREFQFCFYYSLNHKMNKVLILLGYQNAFPIQKHSYYCAASSLCIKCR